MDLRNHSALENAVLKSQKPARYTGGEYGVPDMDKPCGVRFAICFPDVYEVAMSNLGIRILYHLLNDTDGVAAERCFAPWPDFGERLKQLEIPLFSLETRRPLAEFDMIGFSFQYELSYTNLLYMLDLAGFPLLAAERGEEYPVVVCGGPCMFNPEPIADFVDLVQIGDGEELLPALVALYAECKREGASKGEYLAKAAELPGVYVPKLPKRGVRRAVLADLENAYFPTKILVPNLEVVHDRGVAELFRGCTRGCRFCQAGMIYRPVRERSPQTVFRQAREILENSGYEELSLNSLSSGDYSRLSELVGLLEPYAGERRVRLSLPSLRLDSFEQGYALSPSGSLTFAPEAGTQRLRDVINKNVTDADFDRALKAAFAAGCNSVKLYFMMGLPTETDEDLAGIAEMAKRVKRIYFAETSRRRLRVTVSCAVFIPKPFTPFQWEAQDAPCEVERKQRLLAGLLRGSGVAFHYHDCAASLLEAALARGDRRLSAVIAAAYRNGAIFDGWSEFFNMRIWEEAFAGAGLELSEYSGARDLDAPLAWDFIDAGVTREYLLRERERAYRGETTPDCRKGCAGCGLRRLGEGLC